MFSTVIIIPTLKMNAQIWTKIGKRAKFWFVCAKFPAVSEQCVTFLLFFREFGLLRFCNRDLARAKNMTFRNSATKLEPILDNPFDEIQITPAL